MQKLIINADDYGLNPLFDKGIFELAKNHTLTSVSVMVLRGAIDVKSLQKLSNISIGLHLELKEQDTEENIEKQIRLFKNFFGRLPSHLDGHQHCHLSKDTINKVVNIAKKYNLPVRSKTNEDRNFILQQGLKTPDEFISWHPNKTEKLFERIQEAKGDVLELVCHPGYYDAKANVLYNESREKELNFLKSEKFKNILKNFKLVSYDGI